jgi:sugar/nucleoside kinase (ribokinase family)
MVEVLCVGQLVADILVRPVERIDFGIDTQRVELIELRNGGDALNAAVGLSRLGCRVGFVGRIGSDHWGDFLASVIRNEGIEAAGLKRTATADTCAVVVLINALGERVFLYHGGANDEFCLQDVDPALLGEASLIHVGGTHLLPRFDGAGAAQLFASARQQGRLTSMDVTWDTTGRWLATIEPCLPHLSFFLPSVREAREITGREKPEEMALFLQDRGVETVVVKLGTQGCYVKPAGTSGFFSPAFRAEAIDTTGAGDAFVAGFLAGVLRGREFSACARLACAVAALSVQRVGATAGMPSMEEVLRFLRGKELDG